MTTKCQHGKSITYPCVDCVIEEKDQEIAKLKKEVELLEKVAELEHQLEKQRETVSQNVAQLERVLSLIADLEPMKALQILRDALRPPEAPNE